MVVAEGGEGQPSIRLDVQRESSGEGEAEATVEEHGGKSETEDAV